MLYVTLSGAKGLREFLVMLRFAQHDIPFILGVEFLFT